MYHHTTLLPTAVREYINTHKRGEGEVKRDVVQSSKGKEKGGALEDDRRSSGGGRVSTALDRAGDRNNRKGGRSRRAKK